MDFANTIGDRRRPEKERLHAFDDLLRWAAEAGIVDRTERVRLAQEATGDPRTARAAFGRALVLRERLYRLFAGLPAEDAHAPEDLDGLNRTLASALRHLRLERRDGGFDWTWEREATGFDRLLWPVVRSAAELLTSDESRWVRECASNRCTWLFVDRSRTHRRRWCDMKVCGNRAKARRHYRRQRDARN